MSTATTLRQHALDAYAAQARADESNRRTRAAEERSVRTRRLAELIRSVIGYRLDPDTDITYAIDAGATWVTDRLEISEFEDSGAERPILRVVPICRTCGGHIASENDPHIQEITSLVELGTWLSTYERDICDTCECVQP